MPVRSLEPLIPHLRRSALRQDRSAWTDARLLEHFIASREAAAFETLVRRHGPMVLGVCRRLVGNLHDAEDAFQATFLVLARKAATVRPREAVGNWLYGVARTTALRARVGYLTQAPSVYADLTVKQNARYFASLYPGITNADADQAVRDVGLGQAANQLVSTLSGGQHSRASLAC